MAVRDISDHPEPEGTRAYPADELSTQNAQRSDVPGTAVGATVSRYVVLAEVGTGGMGRVLRAYDPRLQREVAVKELRANALSEMASQRLINEARSMAKVSHPNVVPVYDVETLPDGQIILVMQYIAGKTLRDWMKEEPHPWREVVDTLVAAGRGLAAAHKVELLHRDFKPANVLLSDSGAVKVTDFGLAKPASRTMSLGSGEYVVVQSGSDETQTKAGTVLGTPRYMAPEQHSGDELSPAADQFAFCVTLWEALCGEPPYRGRSLARLKRGGPPAWSGEGVPRSIVDALVRGLAVQPDKRWPSMDALLEQLQQDPDKRRSARLAFAGIGVLTVSTAAFGWQAFVGGTDLVCEGARAELETAWGDARQIAVKTALLAEETPYTRALWQRTETRLGDYANAWVAGHEDACEATSVRGVQSEAALDLRMTCLRSAELEFRAVTGVLANADDEVRQNVDAVIDGLPPIDACADVQRLQADIEPPLPEDADRVREGRRLLAEAEAERNGGRYDAALERVEGAEVALVGVKYRAVRAELLLEKGKVLEEVGRYEDAVEPLQQAVSAHASTARRALMRDAVTRLMYVLGKRLTRFDSALALLPVAEGLSRGFPLEEADVANTLALVLVEKGDIDAAEKAQRRSFKLRLDALGPDHPSLANSHHSLAVVLTAQSRHAEALREHLRAMEIWEKTLGPEHPNVSLAMVNVATSYFHQGKYDESEAAHRKALDLRVSALGPEHPEVLHARVNFALALCGQGQWEVCDVELSQAMKLQEEALGPDHRALARTHINLAVAKQVQGQFDEAAYHNERGLEISEATLGPDHHDTAVVRINIANDLARRGKHAEAAEAYRKALGTLQKTLGERHASVAIACNNLGAMLEEQDSFEEAETQYRRALDIRLETLGSEHPKVASVRTALARVLLERDAAEEALPLAEKAWPLASEADPLTWAEAAFTYARALVATSPTKASRERAATLLVAAREGYEKAEAKEDLEKVAAWARTNRVK